jgi:hypothetical protein
MSPSRRVSAVLVLAAAVAVGWLLRIGLGMATWSAETSRKLEERKAAEAAERAATTRRRSRSRPEAADSVPAAPTAVSAGAERGAPAAGDAPPATPPADYSPEEKSALARAYELHVQHGLADEYRKAHDLLPTFPAAAERDELATFRSSRESMIACAEPAADIAARLLSFGDGTGDPLNVRPFSFLATAAGPDFDVLVGTPGGILVAPESRLVMLAGRLGVALPPEFGGDPRADARVPRASRGQAERLRDLVERTEARRESLRRAMWTALDRARAAGAATKLPADRVAVAFLADGALRLLDVGVDSEIDRLLSDLTSARAAARARVDAALR